MRDFRGLEVWQRGKQLAVLVYHVTAGFPKEEIYGLTNQMRRSAVSIPSNIAEGVGRDSDGDFLRFLRIALGSLNELETLSGIAADLGILGVVQAEELENATRDLGVRLRNLAAKVESDIGSKVQAKPVQSNR